MPRGVMAFLVLVAFAVLGTELREAFSRRGLRAPAMEGILFLAIGFALGGSGLGLFPADVLANLRVVVLFGLGCLIIGGVLAGEAAAKLRFPRITGYLLLGMAAGPHALGLETARDAELLRLFEDLALGLIALTAGGEFRVAVIRRRLRPLIAITTAHTFGILLIVSSVLWLLLRVVPFLGAVTPAEATAAVLLLGVIAVAVSPSTTIAVITELRARGEMVETVLGVTIIKDLVILLLFTAVNAVALSWLSGGKTDLSDLGHIAFDILGSLPLGGVLGTVLGFYISKVGRLVPLTVLLLALASVELGRGLRVEHLLVCMAAGSGWRVVRYGWMGFVAQAGLSLGLAARLQRELPGIGESVSALVIAAVVVNQLIGPVLWERAILAVGENREKVPSKKDRPEGAVRSNN